MITGDDRVSLRARLAMYTRLVDRRRLFASGAALLVCAAVGLAANVLHLAVAGSVSLLASVVALDLGLALLALGVLARVDSHPEALRDEPAAADAESDAATAAEFAAGGPPGAKQTPRPRSAAARATTGLSPTHRKLCRELVVFEGRGAVPASVVESLWAGQGSSTEEAASLLDQLADRSILVRQTGGAVVVDGTDVTGSAALTGQKSPAAVHRRLVETYRAGCRDGSWSNGPDDGYFFENIAYHLAMANRTRELEQLLLDYDWLRVKLRVCGVIRLIEDFGHEPRTADTDVVERALTLAAVTLAARPDRLASLLTDRLIEHSSPAIDRLLSQIRQQAPRPWICPVTPALAPLTESPRIAASTVTAAPRPDESKAPPELAGLVEQAAERSVGQGIERAGEPAVERSGREASNRVLAVRGLAVTPDGRRLIAGCDDRVIRIWDLATGRIERILKGHTDSVRAVAVTPDGRRIISGGAYDVVRVWNLASGEFVRTIAGGAGYRSVFTVAVTPDGGKLLWAGAGTALQVWDLARNKLEYTLNSRDSTVRTLAVTKDGRFAVSGGDAGAIHVWDLGAGTLVRTMETRTGPVPAVAVTPDGSRVVSGGGDGIRVWDLGSGRLEGMFSDCTTPVDNLAVTPDGGRIVSGGQDRRARLWDLATGREIASWNPELDSDTDPGRRAVTTAFCPIPTDPGRVACADSAGRVQVLGLLQA